MYSTVSVIIPTYNRAHTLLTALYSALNQTYAPYEIIIVDDASTDNTSAILAPLNDYRIKIIKHLNNQGAAAAKNSGARLAQGEFIAFLDSDDYWDPHKLEFQLNDLLPTLSSTPASVTACWLIRENGHKFYRGYPHYANTLTALAFSEMYNWGSTLLIEKHAFEKVGFFREDLKRFEDWEWAFRYGCHFNFSIFPEPLSYIQNSGWPAFDVASSALEALQHSVIPLLKKHTPSLVTTFQASVCYETAVLNYRNKNYVGFFKYMIKTLITSPAYTLHLLSRLKRKLFQSDWQ